MLLNLLAKTAAEFIIVGSAVSVYFSQMGTGTFAAQFQHLFQHIKIFWCSDRTVIQNCNPLFFCDTGMVLFGRGPIELGGFFWHRIDKIGFRHIIASIENKICCQQMKCFVLITAVIQPSLAHGNQSGIFLYFFENCVA